MGDSDDLRAVLAELGVRRNVVSANVDDLAEETAKAVKRAKGRIPMTEVARLVGLDRTTIYNVYLKS